MDDQQEKSTPTFDVSGVLIAQAGGPYEPLAYEDCDPNLGVVRRVATALLNWWASEKLDWKTWQKRGSFVIAFTEQRAAGESCAVRTALDFDALCDHLRKNRSLDIAALRVPFPNNNWMDAGVAFSVPAHAPRNDGEGHLTYILPQGFGVFAEVMPCLDREGIACSNVLPSIHARVVRLRKRLVSTSRKLFELDGEWHDDLRSFLSASVSSVDATLSRIFHRARQQGSEIGWKLDRIKYPSARAVAPDGKMFAWIAAVTGMPVKDRHGDYPSFSKLREVRHHLHHFDPPTFAMSIDDASSWLNAAHSLGSLLLSIRAGLQLPPSISLIELLLSPTVVAIPRATSLKRFPQPKDAGYASCRLERPVLP